MIAGLRKELIEFLSSRGICCDGMGNRALREMAMPILGIHPGGDKRGIDQFIRGRLEARRSPPPKTVPWEGKPSFPPAKPKIDDFNFYQTDAWRRVRYEALKLHGGSCGCCGARATAESPLHVDHIKPRSKYPELELTLSNLQVLCKDCNFGKGAWDQTDWRNRPSYLDKPALDAINPIESVLASIIYNLQRHGPPELPFYLKREWERLVDLLDRLPDPPRMFTEPSPTIDADMLEDL